MLKILKFHLSTPLLLPFFLLILFFTLSCEEPGETGKVEEYEGPLVSMDNFRILYTDSGMVRLRIEAPKQLEYQNGDQRFPEGFHITFYGEKEEPSSSIRADSGLFDAKKNLYTGMGNVVVKNLQKEEWLKSEILHWNPAKNEIFTDAYVEILSDDETLTGEGLTAKEDFSDYEILNPSGTMTLEEDSIKLE